MQYDALNLNSRVSNDGLLGALGYIKPEEIPNERLRQEWVAVGKIAEPILSGFRALSPLLKTHRTDPNVIEMLAQAKSEGGLVYLLVYYGFDPGILVDEDIRREVETILYHATHFRVAEHHFRKTLYAAAEGQRRLNKTGADS